MVLRILSSLFLCVFCLSLFSQNTVGVLAYDEELYDPGFNLFFSHNQPDVFLLDACGEVVHEWKDADNYRPGNAVYLLENGNLVKCKRDRFSAVADPIWAGGGGETVEVRNWENDSLASFTLNDSLTRLHHDVAPLPNGNILMIAWESKPAVFAVSQGRNPSTLDRDVLWYLAILEWNPTTDSIVWEWHASDHIVQDYDSTQDDFGVVEDNSQLIDINYSINGNPDWLHTNAIDYNPVLDQIVVSVPHFDEFWIIDHSTSIEEAASSSGGNAEMGGDLLYRWGNPAAYKRGDESNKQLFFQHDVHWVSPQASRDESDFGKIALFNNRPPGSSSSGNVLQTTVQNFTYTKLENGVFGPEDFARIIVHPEGNPMSSSSSVSSVQVLENENMLIHSGRWGFSYEVTPENELAWEYRVPLKAGSFVSQGDTLDQGANLTFRMTRYAPDFPAFAGKDLSPKGYLEMDPDEDYCLLLTSSTQDISTEESSLELYPNPAYEVLQIKLNENTISNSRYEVYNLVGERIGEGHLSNGVARHNVSSLPQGSYIIKAGSLSRLFIKS